jgi:aerobic-type carbon monoxide dehydrogenase small subunit (CoxS/CutS family)
LTWINFSESFQAYPPYRKKGPEFTFRQAIRQNAKESDMADENNNHDEGSGINRRNFLKSAGVVVTGSTLGAGLTLATAEAAAAAQAQNSGQKHVAGSPLSNSATIKLKVNGKENQVQIEQNWTLQRTLQFKLGLSGAKQMCDRGVCGSCTVIIDGRAVLSCTTLAVECEGKEIETVEGIAANKKWDPLIQSYCKWDAMQCGYCTPGFVVSAKALLDKNPNPTENDCKQALAGNICCCGTYPRHPTAIMEAAQIIKGGA